jgi:hypothetical protein
MRALCRGLARAAICFGFATLAGAVMANVTIFLQNPRHL